MIPIRDTLPSKNIPVVNHLLIALPIEIIHSSIILCYKERLSIRIRTYRSEIIAGKIGELRISSSLIPNDIRKRPFAIFILLFGPLPEEMAWRGYALDGLQSKWNALEASLILGIAWTIWHLPLFKTHRWAGAVGRQPAILPSSAYSR